MMPDEPPDPTVEEIIAMVIECAFAVKERRTTKEDLNKIRTAIIRYGVDCWEDGRCR